jgi:hypothetical protein
MTTSRSAFLSIPGKFPDIERWLIEVDDEGEVVREITYGRDGRPSKIAAPGEYGLWNDSLEQFVPPGSPEFNEFVLLVCATPVSVDVFEAAWADALGAMRTIDPLGPR